MREPVGRTGVAYSPRALGQLAAQAPGRPITDADGKIAGKIVSAHVVDGVVRVEVELDGALHMQVVTWHARARGIEGGRRG